ncbi:MAG TPA: tRNA-dihydrouridine synthase, partial [Burkholderiaceae bacterium]|nr:tRNA-dihydrouridine synthase [Burkholderiaceae bacterium]
WPAHKPMGIRISATDWRPDLPADAHWDVPDAVAFAQRCERIGADWIDVSSGGVSPQQKIKLGPSYQVPFAEAVKQAVGIPVIAVGLITEAQQAEEIVASGKADMIAMARAMLNNPRWPWQAAAELGASVEAPRQYWRCQPREHPDLFGKIVFGQR